MVQNLSGFKEKMINSESKVTATKRKKQKSSDFLIPKLVSSYRHIKKTTLTTQ